MKITGLLLLFLVITNNAISQNLVPNGSFEEYNECPDGSGLSFVDYWFNPNNNWPSSPNYFNSCAPEGGPYDIPENWSGNQESHDGEAYAGVYCYGNDSGQREYIQVQLVSPLIENQEYVFSMYVSLADRFELGINNFGALFTDYEVVGDGDDHAFIEADPQVKAELPIIEYEDWVQITGAFIAEGGEEYLTIGNFFSDENTEAEYSHWADFPNWSYYYIDSVSLTPVILNIDDNTLESLLSVYPNPISDSFTIELATDHSKVTVKLYSIVGELILQREIENQLLKVDVSDLSTGIYLLEITDSKANRVIKRLSKL